ncbi:MAG: PepSY domain-containing protein [Anaerotignaceae bacterium]
MTITTKKIITTTLLLLALFAIVFSFTVQASPNISLNEAKTAALKHANLTNDQVTFVKTASYEKQGIYLYDLEFLNNTTKYSYEINKTNGNIISYYTKDLYNHSNDHDDDDDYYKMPDTSKFITDEKAQTIALEHSGVSATSISKIKCKLDEDDGMYVYEIEFKKNNTDYEYEIDAYTGKLLDWEWDN